ncbi:MAG: VacJ family lipoprotein [Pseudomonadota bacterium]
MPDFYVRFRALLICGLISLTMLGGCASTGNPRDPIEPFNRGVYQFNDALDKALLKPAAEAYRGVLPQFVRTGVSNFFSNINDVIVALNNLLQGKLIDAVSDVGRIVVNSTAGLLGVLDVATELGLEKHDEDFGQTLGYWGMGDGPYLVLPLLGPKNLRDTVGLIVDYKTDPITYIDPTRDRNIVQGVRIINRRSELLETSKILEAAALDPYEFVRDAYLQRRRNLVHDGSPPPEKDDDTEIKMKPRSKLQDGRNPADVGAAGSILVSGDETLYSPARLEAREKAAREAERPAQPVSGASRTSAAQPASVVRLWLP